MRFNPSPLGNAPLGYRPGDMNNFYNAPQNGPQRLRPRGYNDVPPKKRYPSKPPIDGVSLPLGIMPIGKDDVPPKRMYPSKPPIDGVSLPLGIMPIDYDDVPPKMYPSKPPIDGVMLPLGIMPIDYDDVPPKMYPSKPPIDGVMLPLGIMPIDNNNAPLTGPRDVISEPIDEQPKVIPPRANGFNFKTFFQDFPGVSDFFQKYL
jgi:hypothetical protein